MKHDNNFDLLRLLAAFAVVGYHMGELSQQPEFHALVEWGSRWALEIFFVISGYLIFQSYEKSKSLKIYFVHRLRRIAPGYVFIIFFAVLLGAAQTTLAWTDYFGVTTAKYVLSNLLLVGFVQPGLPGVFTENTWTAVNGSLWTIRVEVMFYLCVPIFAYLFRRFGRDRMLVLGYLLSACWWGVLTHLAASTGRHGLFEVAKQMPGQLTFFFSGAALYYHRDLVVRHRTAVGLAGALGMLACETWDLEYLHPLAISLLTIYIALGIPRLVNATRFGDMSYGIYLLHFPLLQTMVHFGLFQYAPWASLVFFLVVLVLGAQISWHFVEKPFLPRRGIAKAPLAAPLDSNLTKAG